MFRWCFTMMIKRLFLTLILASFCVSAYPMQQGRDIKMVSLQGAISGLLGDENSAIVCGYLDLGDWEGALNYLVRLEAQERLGRCRCCRLFCSLLCFCLTCCKTNLFQIESSLEDEGIVVNPKAQNVVEAARLIVAYLKSQKEEKPDEA